MRNMPLQRNKWESPREAHGGTVIAIVGIAPVSAAIEAQIDIDGRPVFARKSARDGVIRQDGFTDFDLQRLTRSYGCVS